MADDIVETYRIYRRWFIRKDRSNKAALAVIREAYAAGRARSTRAGYEQAIAVLAGVAARTGSPAARWAAEYLEADPGRQAPRDAGSYPGTGS